MNICGCFLVLMLWAVICRRLNAAMTAKSPQFISVLIHSELSQHSITISDGPPIYSVIVLIHSELSQHSITVSNGLNLHYEGYRLKSMTCVWLFHVC